MIEQLNTEEQVRQARQMSRKNTAKNQADKRAAAAAEARANNPALQAIWEAFIPTTARGGESKYVTDHWGNRILRADSKIDERYNAAGRIERRTVHKDYGDGVE